MPKNPKQRSSPLAWRIAQFTGACGITTALIAAAANVLGQYMETRASSVRSFADPQQPVVTQVNTAAPADAVYVTTHGKKYHRAGCQHIKGHQVFRITVADAHARNLAACLTCKPP